MVAAVAVRRDVEGLVVVQELEHVGGGWGVDDGGGDELVHGFVVGGLGGVVHEAGATAVDGAGEEGHAQGFLVRDALEGANEVGALEVLWGGGQCEMGGFWRGDKEPLIHASIDRAVRRACRFRQRG